jgi:hypothetical protein
MNDDPEHSHAAAYCAAELIRDRQRRGQPVPNWLRQHLARCEAAVAVSRSGHEFDGVPSQLDPDNLIDAREVARMLGISKRQAQRLAHDIDGLIISGRWVFRKATVMEYAEARK